MRIPIFFSVCLFLCNSILFCQNSNKPESIIITANKPLSKDSIDLRKKIISWTDELLKGDYKKVKAHPSSAIFPGNMQPGFTFTDRTIHINNKSISDTMAIIAAYLDYSDPWKNTMYSTGLYAAPGEYIEIITKRKGLEVQIGAHTDQLNWGWASNEDWRRMPIITVRKELKENTRITSPFGGLIYINVPLKEDSFDEDILIKHAVSAPLYVLDKTSLSEWIKILESNKAPWGELAGKNLILTLPDSVVKKIKDPEKTMQLWDLIIEGEMELAQLPAPFYRQQRMVIDEHMAAGGMHSGYPIMIHHSPSQNMLSAAVIADPELLMKPSGGGANWGFFHEIGHNMQSSAWVFGSTTEVSCNFFTLYMFDRLVGGRDNAHEMITNAKTKQLTEEYFKQGVSYETWKNEPFLGLIMFRQLQEAFGWESFKAFFKVYQNIAFQYNREKRPEFVAEKKIIAKEKVFFVEEISDQQKIDRWVMTFSTIVSKNLFSFFKTWGIPVSAAVNTKLSKFPTWMPYNFPSKE